MSKEITNVSIDVLKIHPRNTEFLMIYLVNSMRNLRTLLKKKVLYQKLL
jgi:hypothetical protein